MTWFSAVFYKNRRFISLILASIIFLLTVFSAGFFRPLLGNIAATVFFSPFSKFKHYIIGLQDVAEENRQLRSLIAESSLQLNVMTEARRENQRLREFLGFEPPENFRVVPVKIVALMQNIYPVAAMINKGSRDSIRINQPVVNRFGLVGKIKEVMPDHATVILLTDPANAVSGRVAESRQIGIVRFSPALGMYFDNLPADSDIKEGDLIISSGLGGVYPSGLSVAIVDTVWAERGDILKSVRLKPTVNFFEIDELYILISEES
nr:rod shape-determining protein MreC [candidate division Zixibacteria bacterium]